MYYNLFHNTSCQGDIYSFQTSPRNTTEAKFIKYFSDKTVIVKPGFHIHSPHEIISTVFDFPY